MRQWVRVWLVCEAVLLPVAGCQSPEPKRFEPIPPKHEQPPPAATKDGRRAAANRQRRAPAPPPPASPAARPQPPAPPAAPPSYVAVLEPVDPTRGTSLHTTVETPNRIRLRTGNVRRLSITRRGSPLVRDRSIVLRIDTQVFEWLPRYTALELTRSENGVWRITRRVPPKRPRSCADLRATAAICTFRPISPRRSRGSTASTESPQRCPRGRSCCAPRPRGGPRAKRRARASPRPGSPRS